MPYRNTDLPDDEPPPREHVYSPLHRRAFNSAAPAAIAVVPVLAGAVGAGVGGPIAGLVTAIGSGIGLWFLHKSSKTRGQIRFTMDRGRLLFNAEAIPLSEIEDVVLDTKTIERVQDGSALIPALQGINQTVGPASDTARIEIVMRTRSIHLTDEFLSYTETSDAIAKLRVFLRKNGWLPIDERDAPKKKKKKRKPA